MNHEYYMNICLELAKKGKGNVAPNPMVGCVIVYEENIIGKGYHEQFGSAHAEVNAINSVKNTSLLKKSRMYVNLEPCSHHGKTPPCSDLIIRNEIPHVIIGTIDNHSKVAGKGIEKLKKYGIKVEVGIEKEKCIELNKRFHKFHTEGLPYIILKWAQSKDGFISRTLNDIKKGKNNWITGEKSIEYVHKQRAYEQAILIGSNTVKIDNPLLTTRGIDGKSPLRVVITSQPLENRDLNILRDHLPTLIFNKKLDKKEENKEWVQFDGAIKSVLQNLADRDIQSVIVEGGANILNQFIDQNLWDEAYTFVGDVIFNNGIMAPKIIKNPSSTKKIGKDELIVYLNR
tara:strand:+ start:3623 stop:4654 length:1032 start_codon:yes stop_codon:yes gene_type:complete